MVGGATLHEGIWDFFLSFPWSKLQGILQNYIWLRPQNRGVAVMQQTPGDEKESEKQKATRNVSGFCCLLPGSKQPKTEKPQKTEFSVLGCLLLFFGQMLNPPTWTFPGWGNKAMKLACYVPLINIELVCLM